MTERAHQYAPHGIASWYFPDDPNDEHNWIGKTSNGTYLPVLDKALGPIKGMTFRPDFQGDSGHDYKGVDFEKILNKVGVKPRRTDSVRRGSNGLVIEYCVN
jgi:hypothetical protein